MMPERMPTLIPKLWNKVLIDELMGPDLPAVLPARSLIHRDHPRYVRCHDCGWNGTESQLIEIATNNPYYVQGYEQVCPACGADDRRIGWAKN